RRPPYGRAVPRRCARRAVPPRPGARGRATRRGRRSSRGRRPPERVAGARPRSLALRAVAVAVEGDRVALDQRIREQPLAHPVELLARFATVVGRELDVDEAADACFTDVEAEVAKRALD